jgi:TPR repeat protein
MMQVETSLGGLAFQAEGGDAGAQYRLGVLFLLGESVDQDLEAAYQWLSRAADGQYPGASLLAEKLAARLRSELEPKKLEAKKSPIRFPAETRSWFQSAFAAAATLGRNATRSIAAVPMRLSFLRTWKYRMLGTSVSNLIARARFQFRTQPLDLPGRRREGFQFRDSL